MYSDTIVINILIAIFSVVFCNSIIAIKKPNKYSGIVDIFILVTVLILSALYFGTQYRRSIDARRKGHPDTSSNSSIHDIPCRMPSYNNPFANNLPGDAIDKVSCIQVIRDEKIMEGMGIGTATRKSKGVKDGIASFDVNDLRTDPDMFLQNLKRYSQEADSSKNSPETDSPQMDSPETDSPQMDSPETDSPETDSLSKRLTPDTRDYLKKFTESYENSFETKLLESGVLKSHNGKGKINTRFAYQMPETNPIPDREKFIKFLSNDLTNCKLNSLDCIRNY